MSKSTGSPNRDDAAPDDGGRAEPSARVVEPELAPRRARAFKLIRPLIAVAALAFAIVAFRSLLGRWDGSELEIRWGWVAVAALPMCVGSVGLAFGWMALIAKMSGVRMPRGRALVVHLESQLGRYVPGKVGTPLLRMTAAPSLGVSARIAASSVFVEVIGVLSVGAVLGVVLLVSTSNYLDRALGAFEHWGWVLVGLLLAGTLLLTTLDRRHFPAFLRALLPAGSTGSLLPVRTLFWFGSYWVGWALHGVVLSVGVGAKPEVAVAGAGLYVLAPIVGFAAVAAPAGLGVREAVLSIALAEEIGATAAIAAALLSRMISLAAEVGTWVVARAILGASGKRR